MHEINKWILKIDFDFTTDGEKVLSLGLDWEINILGMILYFNPICGYTHVRPNFIDTTG